MTDAVIRVERLQKEFRQGFFMRRVQAVKDISFQVDRGDIFGFLGPNGAGKTTTIKMLTGLISPTGGRAELFGELVPNRKARARIGFLPENPYVYPYLTPTEFVVLCGRLSGLRPRAARDRTREVLEQVGVAYAADRPVRRLSKGMLQRTGLAAALVADPELLILDEPMSGLDPVGRKEVRDLIVDERRRGRTIFFSTHILNDVESLCDRVAILRKGEVVVSGRIDELLRRDARRSEITIRGDYQDLRERLTAEGASWREVGGLLLVSVEGENRQNEVLRRALDAGLSIEQVVPRHETLEELFLREAITHGETAPH
ncbi:MAG: putative transporter, ATP-binding protein [Polyangiaceae bacterium]|nr:putative transporter, ATP-binding protein [Polyangiaceae bacterium]